jgi:signal transduction histidine kinase
VQATDTESLRQELAQVRDRAEHLERALVQAQRFATIGQLACRMAHEFNNILMLITGRAQQALKHGDAAMRDEALRKAVASGQRAADIVSGLLGYANGRQGRSQRVGARDLMDAALSLIAWDLPKDGIELVRRYDANPPVRVVPGRIEQVLLNLLLNARKAMAKRGGTLTAAVGPAPADGYVALAVRDTGCGIPADNLSRIFDPFFTAGGPGAEEGGTGLGLAVARDLVRQAGGEIHAESEPGAGSTFTVLLPIAESNASA